MTTGAYRRRFQVPDFAQVTKRFCSSYKKGETPTLAQRQPSVPSSIPEW
jgi:hypothetical protein